MWREILGKNSEFTDGIRTHNRLYTNDYKTKENIPDCTKVEIEPLQDTKALIRLQNYRNNELEMDQQCKM